MTDKIKIAHLEGTSRRIDDNTKIVRYMKLETLLLLLFERRVFIPSHATLGEKDRLEKGILFDLPDQKTFWQNWAETIGPRMDDFLSARLQREFKSRTSSFVREPQYNGKFVGTAFRKYVDDLATKRCVWCWNKFRTYSNALWHLYGNRGVAVTSTVGKVKAALINAGAARGIVAPIAYINHERTRISKVLTKEENIFSPYLLKSVAYDYEKEIRFVLAAQREILRDHGGVLISINAASFIDGLRFSPHLQLEEQSILKSMVRGLLKKARAVNKPSTRDPTWIKRYKPFNGTPFTTEDSLPFSDLVVSKCEQQVRIEIGYSF